jgi:hypothetical protein
MKKALLALFLILFSGTAMADPLVYEGTWLTTRTSQLEGRMTANVEDLGNNKWKGRFYGVWQGRPFSYDVEWTGPHDKMSGKARIDGADYDWKGEMAAHSPGWFKGTFTSRRYTGSFDLKGKAKK